MMQINGNNSEIIYGMHMYNNIQVHEIEIIHALIYIQACIIYFQRTYQRSNTLLNIVFFIMLFCPLEKTLSRVSSRHIQNRGVHFYSDHINLQQQHKTCNHDNKNAYAVWHCVVKQLNISNIESFNLF